MTDPDTVRLGRKLMAACISHRLGVSAERALRLYVPRRDIPRYWVDLAGQIKQKRWRSLNAWLTKWFETQESN